MEDTTDTKPVLKIGDELYISLYNRWHKIKIIRGTPKFWIDDKNNKYHKEITSYGITNGNPRYFIKGYSAFSKSHAYIPYPELLEERKRDEMIIHIKSNLYHIERIGNYHKLSTEDLEALNTMTTEIRAKVEKTIT